MNRRRGSHGTAIAPIHGGPSYPDIRGEVRFQQRKNGVLVTAEIVGLPENSSTNPTQPAIFGFHIHTGSSCDGTPTEPFAGAGAHFSKEPKPHPAHSGDLPPLFGNHGYAYMTVFTDRFSVREILGRTVIIHRDPDNLMTQPAGNSGARIACGVIRPL